MVPPRRCAARDLYPWVRKKSIARVELSDGDGVVVGSGSDLGPGHFDWWPSDYAVDPGGEVVEEAVA